MRTLVTGATGFVGRHLCRLLESRGIETVAISQGSIDVLNIDIRDRDAVIAVFKDTRPDNVVHLAAVAYVPEANSDPALADAVNRGGTVNVLDGAREVGARALFISSGAVYGAVASDEQPIRETQKLAASDVYGMSKVSAERECVSRRLEQDIVRVRPFNHTGPGQSPQYVCSDFASQLVNAEAGLCEARIEVGDLRSERDFSDVRDVVRAYVDLLEKGEAGEVYNVCSGTPTSIRQILDLMVEQIAVPVEIVVQQDRLRPGEVSRAYGCYEKIQASTGWRPEIAMRDTLRELLEGWRRELAAARSGVRV
jgi:GDP-4-dehydro-6-deoxy-D-mannose reductase